MTKNRLNGRCGLTVSYPNSGHFVATVRILLFHVRSSSQLIAKGLPERVQLAELALALLRRVAAIHHQLGTRYVRCFVRRQEKHCVGDFER